MLPDALFKPLDLDDLLEKTFEEGGRPAVVDLLESVLGDPRAEADEAFADYLDELIEQLTELERFPEAIAATYRLIEVDAEALRAEELGSIAQLHALNGDLDTSRALLLDLRADHETAAPQDRDLWHALMNTLVMADNLGDPALAVAWLSEDLRTGLELHWDPDLVQGINGHRKRIAGSAFADPKLDRQVELYLENNRFTSRTEEAEGPRHTRFSYPGTGKREIELGMRADLNARIDGPDGQIAWPPGRNDTCWCGSGAKYKKCCAAPSFLAG
ncbi:MAG: SEC-C domain-containing protein [Streptosporangiaceae bacterium]